MSRGYINQGKSYRTEIAPEDLPVGFQQCEHQGCRRASLSKMSRFCSIHGGWFTNLSGSLRRYFEDAHTRDLYSLDGDLALYDARIRAALDAITFRDAPMMMEEARGLVQKIKASAKTDGELDYESINRLEEIVQWEGETSDGAAEDFMALDAMEGIRLRILDLHVRRQAVMANSVVARHFVAFVGAVLTAIETRVVDPQARSSLGREIAKLSAGLVSDADGSPEMRAAVGDGPS